MIFTVNFHPTKSAFFAKYEQKSALFSYCVMFLHQFWVISSQKIVELVFAHAVDQLFTSPEGIKRSLWRSGYSFFYSFLFVFFLAFVFYWTPFVKNWIMFYWLKELFLSIFCFKMPIFTWKWCAKFGWNFSLCVTLEWWGWGCYDHLFSNDGSKLPALFL